MKPQMTSAVPSDGEKAMPMAMPEAIEIVRVSKDPGIEETARRVDCQ
jgi:hypothetical protein